MNKKDKRIWTIGFVNYKTSLYLKYQFKSLFRFNDPESFCIIILDNSVCEEEKNKLEELVSQYSNYGNIEVIYHTPKEKTASGQHGEGLTIIKDKCKTEFFLAQDPDFFWIKQNHLKFLEDKLRGGMETVGAPYENPVGIGAPDFPSAFGCAYKTKKLVDLDFTARTDEESIAEGRKKYPQLGFCYDVGWKIREVLSKEKYLTFSQEHFFLFKDLKHSFECITHLYRYGGEPIAIHLFRGSFTGEVTKDHCDPKAEINQQVVENRIKICNNIYDIIDKGTLPKISFVRGLESTKRRIVNRLLHTKLIFSLMTYLRKSKFGKKIIKTVKKLVLD